MGKYEVTGKVSSSVGSVVEKAKTTESTKQVATTVSSAVDSVTRAIENVDKDVGIKDSVGTVLTSGSELAAKAVEKVIDLNAEYKVTNQIVDKITEATKKATSK